MTAIRSKSAPRYILYTRVSTDRQRDNFSHDSQLDALLEHTQRKGGRVVARFEETESGGSYLKRKKLLEALTLIENDEADVFCCFDFSRYSRDRKHQEFIADRVHRAGKRLEFATFNLEYDDDGELTPESGLMADVSGDFAKYQRVKTRADSIRGSRKAAKDGTQINRRAPFGYHIKTKADALRGLYPDLKIGGYVIVEEEAKWVREVFARRSQGWGVWRLAAWLNSEGVKTKLGHSWSAALMSQLLSRSTYKGEATYGKRRRVYDEARLERGLVLDFSIQKRPDSQVIKIPCPALVSTAQWDAVQTLKGSPPQFANKTPTHLLSAVLRCPTCKGATTGLFRHFPKSGKVRVYVCRAAHGMRDVRCQDARGWYGSLLEPRVRETLLRLCDDEAFLASLLVPTTPVKPSNLRPLEEQLQTLVIEEEATVRAQIRALQNGIESDVYDKILGEISIKRRALNREIEAAQKQTKAHPPHLKQSLARLKALLSQDESESLVDLHAFLIAFFEAIEIEPLRGKGKTAEFDLRFRLR